MLLNIVLRTRRIQSGCRGGPVRLEEGVARYEGFSVGFPRLSSPRGPRTGATNPTCNHRRTGSSFHVLGSRSDFASFGAEHSSGPREVGHHRHALHAWVTLSPRVALPSGVCYLLVLTYGRAVGQKIAVEPCVHAFWFTSSPASVAGGADGRFIVPRIFAFVPLQRDH